jgi:hypothetical protein
MVRSCAPAVALEEPSENFADPREITGKFHCANNTYRAGIQRLEVIHQSYWTHLVPCNIFLFLNAKDLHRGTDFESSDDLHI